MRLGADLDGVRGMAKLPPGTVVEGISERLVVNGDGSSVIRYKIKFTHYSEIESGWVSRDMSYSSPGSGDVEECFVAFSCLESKLNQFHKSNKQEELTHTAKMDVLKQLSFSVILHAPMSTIGHWLDSICCYEKDMQNENATPSSGIATSLVQGQEEDDPWSRVLKSNSDNNGGVCGYLFKRGDMAWNCRTCQSDGTCVQCDACFRRSDHTNHDVFFHATAPGGCCDCGDPEAWADAGCCDKHRAKQSQDNIEDVLPNQIVNNTTEVCVCYLYSIIHRPP